MATFTHTYDAAGRMVGAQVLTATPVYTYNGDSLWVEQAMNGELAGNGPGRDWFPWPGLPFIAAPLIALPELTPALAPLGAPVTTTHRVISYTYDSLYRLISATYSTNEFYHYTYDAVGNRQSLTTGGGVVNYQYDAANRLTSVNGQAYIWDDNGNLLSDGVRTYTYTHANRLTQVVSGTLTTGFTYNGAGDRVAKTVDGVTTAYVLDGSTGLTTGPAAGLTQVLQESTSGQTTSYLYGHDGSTGLTAGLLAQYDSGTWAYHVNDGLGSVRQLADPAGQVVQSYSFSPYGVPLGESGGEPYGFTGEQWDAEVELLYLRARYYAPEDGIFLSRDAWGGDELRSQSMNGWSYVEGNPINYTDPTGECSEEAPDAPPVKPSREQARELIPSLDQTWLIGDKKYRTTTCCAKLNPCQPCVVLFLRGVTLATDYDDSSVTTADDYMRFWLAWEKANPCCYRAGANCLGAALEVSGLYTGKDFGSYIRKGGYSDPITDWPGARKHFWAPYPRNYGWLAAPGDLYRTSFDAFNPAVDAHFVVRTAHSSSGGTLYFQKQGPKGHYELLPLSKVPRWWTVEYYIPRK